MRVLLVSPVSPFTRRSGSEQRSRLFLHALRDLADCDVLQLEEGKQTSMQRLAMPDSTSTVHVHAVVRTDWAPWRRFVPNPALTRQIEHALGRSLADYAVVVGRYLWPVCQLNMPLDLPVVVDLDDWRYRRDRQAPGSPVALVKVLRKAYAHWLAARQLHRFAAAFAVSDIDVRELQGRMPVPVQWLPNMPPVVPHAVSAVPASRQLMFVGSLWYPPNLSAVNWLLSRVWPGVLRRVPDARLLLAGTAPRQVRQAWAQTTGVSAPGFVEDLEAAYAACCGVVAPMLEGAGSNIKVLEAMVHGRPCVVSPLVHAAFAAQLQAGRHYLVAASPQAFTQHLVDLLLRPQEHQDMADCARARVTDVFDPAVFARQLVDGLQAAHLPGLVR